MFERYGDSGLGALQPATCGRSHARPSGWSHPQLQHLQFEQNPVSGEFSTNQEGRPDHVSSLSSSSVVLSCIFWNWKESFNHIRLSWKCLCSWNSANVRPPKKTEYDYIIPNKKCWYPTFEVRNCGSHGSYLKRWMVHFPICSIHQYFQVLWKDFQSGSYEPTNLWLQNC